MEVNGEKKLYTAASASRGKGVGAVLENLL